MEKRSRRRTRDLVTQAASQGLSENEIGYARISMMARSTNAPCKGRIQMRKTNPLRLLKFGLQRTAGPYKWVISDGFGDVRATSGVRPTTAEKADIPVRLQPLINCGTDRTSPSFTLVLVPKAIEFFLDPPAGVPPA
jgi:hypothetical protein